MICELLVDHTRQFIHSLLIQRMSVGCFLGVGHRSEHPRGLSCNQSACQCRRHAGSILGCGRSPGEGNGKPLQYSCLGNPMDRKGLVGYSPWGCKRVRENLVTKQQQQSQPQAMFSVHIYCLRTTV